MKENHLLNSEIPLDLYRIFYYVAEELSFSKAAARLYVSQSAVSQAIASLENQLATVLFHRSTKKVSLSQEGITLFSYLEPAFHLIDSAQKHLSDLHELKRGKLHIGVSDTICKYYLIDYLKVYHERYVDVEILITNRSSLECVNLLKKNQVDMIITNLPNQEIDESLKVYETIEFQDKIIAPRSFKGLDGKSNDFSDLLDYPILMLDEQSSTTQFLKNAFFERGLSLKPAIELGSIDLLIELSRIGLGLTFVPDYTIKTLPSSLMVVATTHTLQKRKLGIVTQAKLPLSSAAKAFIDTILHYKPGQPPYSSSFLPVCED